MQKIKNLACLLVFSLLLFSCGEYQKVLNKGSIEDQYKMAVKMYEGKILSECFCENSYFFFRFATSGQSSQACHQTYTIPL